MGLFPTKIVETEKVQEKKAPKQKSGNRPRPGAKTRRAGPADQHQNPRPWRQGQTEGADNVHRQLATLVDAGLPLLRGLRVLEKQERSGALRRILGELALAIEGGSTFPRRWRSIPKFSTVCS